MKRAPAAKSAGMERANSKMVFSAPWGGVGGSHHRVYPRAILYGIKDQNQPRPRAFCSFSSLSPNSRFYMGQKNAEKRL